MKTITLYDVARHAGVSYQTVSRVINDAAHVSARTREKVQAAMAALHYVPNRGAQQLAGKRSKTLGLVTTDLALHAPSQIASAVKSRAGQAGASVMISMVEQHDEQSCAAALQELLAQRVEGVLINVPLDDALAQQLAAQAAPVPVLFLDVSDTATVNSLVFDAAQGARLGVEHLRALGHQRIALLGGPESSVSARARFSGWLAALEEAKLSPLAYCAPARQKALPSRSRSRWLVMTIPTTVPGFRHRSPPCARRSKRRARVALTGCWITRRRATAFARYACRSLWSGATPAHRCRSKKRAVKRWPGVCNSWQSRWLYSIAAKLL